MPDDSALQEGIYFRPSDRPPGRCYRLVLLNIAGGVPLRRAGQAIAQVWTLLGALKEGRTNELGEPPTAADVALARSAKLTCLLAFGATLFRRHREVQTPPHVVPLEELSFPSLPWKTDRGERKGEADLAIQLIANTDLAVERALVETWLLIKEKGLPLELVTVYGGFNREDRRSWLGFHDGISNVDPAQRREVIEVPVKAPPWMFGGTYMAFFRLALDLAVWRKESRARQEILVGRDKVTGCPLASVNRQEQPVPMGGCPVGANPPDSRGYIRGPELPVAERLLRQSHIHRTNPNRAGVADGDHRIFRQGYEFVETLTGGDLRVGLNFVSFQRDLQRLMGILNQFTWLRDANFGGNGDVKFVSLIDGGFYAVPPNGGTFPGAALFNPGA